MSSTVSFYLLDLDKLKEIFNNKDLKILDQLDKIDEDERECLESLLTGDGSNEDSEAEYGYGYALEKIVEHIGERVIVPELESLHFAEFDAQPIAWIMRSGPPVPIALNNDDFPYIGHRYLADMQKVLAEWNDDKFDDFEPEIQEMIEGLLSVFQTAVEQKKDLITFYY